MTEESSFGCPVCGEEWVPVQDGGEMRTEYMDRHRKKHEADIPAKFFFENDTRGVKTHE